MKNKFQIVIISSLFVLGLLLTGCNNGGFKSWQKQNEAFQEVAEKATATP